MTQRTDSHLIFRDFKRSYPEIVRGEGIYLYDHNGKKYLDGQRRLRGHRGGRQTISTPTIW